MIASGFAGIFIVGKTATASGDLIVTDGSTYVIRDLQQFVDGDVVVTDGTLKIIDGTLSVISNYDQRYTITVGVDGELILDHGVITTHLDQLNPWAELEIIIEDGGILTATNESILMFPGSITLSDGAEMTLMDSTITALSAATVSQYVVGSLGLITLDSADDGPAISVTDSTLNLFDSSIDSLPEFASDAEVAGNLTLSGGSTLLSVNSYIGVDFGPVRDASSWYTHNCLVVNDESEAHLYGTYFETYLDILADRAPAVVVTGISTSPAVPDGVASLANVDALMYVVDATETLEVINWDVNGVLGTLPVSAATIVATYSVDPAYDGSNAIQWRPDAGVYSSTGIIPDAADAPGMMAAYQLSPASVPTVADIMTMDVRFIHNGAAGSVQFDALWVVFSVGGSAYVYRWLNATAGDEYGVPIPEATISAVFTGATDLEGQEAFYFTPSGVSASPAPEVLEYMGATALDFKTTKDDGRAVIPYLTDIIVSDGSMNSKYVGSYAVTASTVIDTVVYSSTESFSFPAYPAMKVGDQRASLTVDLLGVSVPSPDDSRWLVVPLETGEETVVVEDMLYYHAGDVIVASTGELTFLNSELQIVQAFANERTIYVDGNGVLRFENAVVESQLPINIIVQGFGTLEVIDSTLTGVSIVAKEDAVVVLDGSTMTSGGITTSWNSRADIKVYDCVLTSTPVLSGFAIGSFTNTSVPSIDVLGDARALIFRWIHVTVLDGNMKPLPGVLVSARFYLNQSHWTSEYSDSTGVAKLNCLGTIITEDESSFIGNYWVNASYTPSWTGVTYESDQQVSVGVLPYTEPLVKNATYTTLTIVAALPNLVIASTGSVTSTPEEPLNGQETTISAEVRNLGIAVAYDVQVDFTDKNDDYTSQFASVVYPSIAPHPTESVLVNATWIAEPPLMPRFHTMIAEVDPLNTIIETDEAPAIGSGVVFVQNLPDVMIVPESSIYVTPHAPIVDTECMLNVVVANIGDNNAVNFVVAFYNASLEEVAPENLIGEVVVPFMSSDTGNIVVSVAWTPTVVGEHTLSAIVNEAMSYPEISYANNNISAEITVYDYPDMELTSISFVSSPSTIAGGDSVVVRVEMVNNEDSPVMNPVVALYVDDPDGDEYANYTYPGILTSGSGPVLVDIVYTAPIVSDTVVYDIIMVVNPYDDFAELTLSNNVVSSMLTVTDVRADLVITSTRINVIYDGEEVTEQMFGRTVNITADVENLGARPASGLEILFSVRGVNESLNYTIETLTGETVPAGSIAPFSAVWTINFSSPGTYWICVEVDSAKVVTEPNEANNYAEAEFTVLPLAVDVTVSLEGSEFATGSTIVVMVAVYYQGTVVPVVGVHVRLAMYDSQFNIFVATITPDPSSAPLMTGPAGSLTESIIVPTDLPGGNYHIGVTIQDEEYFTTSTFAVTGEVSGEGIPMIIWIIVILAIVGVVIGFTAYTYVYGLGKLVECGECGAFIPAASKRCPKCGVEFEVGTMKCSECGAWVPSDAGECPNCGVKFVGEPEGDDLDYLERMKAGYEAMVSEYRELAKPELGKKFSDKKFEEWWKDQPSYVSFDDWLAKEEEKRKEGPMACPVCGTLNPREATVCHKCGTVFAVAEGEPALPDEGGPGIPMEPSAEAPPPMEQPPARRPPEGGAGGGAAEAPRMVIRRPIDRKVVPKKIIRTPVDKNGDSDAK
jgi:ribosomal protein L40E